MNKLKNSTCVVFGGLGNIGSFIVDKLINDCEPNLVIIVDNRFNSDTKERYIIDLLNKKNVAIYNLDISSYQDLLYVFDKYNIDYVFHQASTLINDSEELPHKAIDTNIKGSYNIVDLCNKFKVKKIVYASSATVFGEPKYLPVDEDHPYQYNNFVYGWTKICVEMIFISNCKIPWNGFRYYNVYSERINRGTYYTQVIKIMIDKILKGESVTIFGDGTQTMDLIHAEDIANVNILSIESDVENGFFNLGTGIETSVNELVELLTKFSKNKVDVVYSEHIDTQRVKRRRSSMSKAKSMLNWEPRITVENGVKRVLRTYNLLKPEYDI